MHINGDFFYFFGITQIDDGLFCEYGSVAFLMKEGFLFSNLVQITYQKKNLVQINNT